MLAPVALIALHVVAPTTVQGLFTDNMVLQQQKPVPVWGRAEPGQAIIVTLAGHSAVATASSRGNWMATLPPMRAGGPYTLTIQGDHKLELSNVAVGEVWVCSGQSNMEFPLIACQNGPAEVAAASNPDIRLYHVNHRTVDEPLRDIDGVWLPSRPDSARNFSAVATFFARQLYQKLHVPIGLIESDWGGTPAESWTPKSTLLGDPALRKMTLDYQATLPTIATAIEKYRKEMATYSAENFATDPGNKGLGQGWADPNFNDVTWSEAEVPGNWERTMKLNIDGACWYRKTIDIPASQAGLRIQLQLGAIDDYDTTYFNGEQIGATGAETYNSWSKPRLYTVPGRLVRAGKNVIAVRVWDSGGEGGMTGGSPLRVTAASGLNMPLEGYWKFAVENAVTPRPAQPAPVMPLIPGNPNVPSSLWNGMIAALPPFAVRGVIWYQGESNAYRAYQYRTLFPKMIQAWRTAFNQGDLPFYFVQLANFAQRSPNPTDSDWAELREAQAMTLKLPNTGMACIIDVGAADTIHPLDKQDVGRRLSLLALSRLYGSGGEDTGPTFKSLRISGKSAIVSFDHVGGGIIARGGPPIGFSIAGADRKFYWAEAHVERGALVLTSAHVPQPVAVRYGWDINPATNLYNGAGLPMVPFRTDTWPGITQGRS